jgi:hypothetical protein
MDDPLLMYVSDRAGELSNPELDGFLSEGLARDVESKITPIHQIHDDVSARRSGSGLIEL